MDYNDLKKLGVNINGVNYKLGNITKEHRIDIDYMPRYYGDKYEMPEEITDENISGGYVDCSKKVIRVLPHNETDSVLLLHEIIHAMIKEHNIKVDTRHWKAKRNFRSINDQELLIDDFSWAILEFIYNNTELVNYLLDNIETKDE